MRIMGIATWRRGWRVRTLDPEGDSNEMQKGGWVTIRLFFDQIDS
jgi:hypothetical protein